MTLIKSDLVEKGISYFKGGYNCAQSVLLAMQDFWDVEDALEPKVASAFGGGIGGRGSLCGALTGGVIAIGLRHGSNAANPEERKVAYALALRLYTAFQKDCSSVYCRELIGYDLTDPRELEKARNSGIFKERCIHFIESALRTLADMK